MATAGIGGAKLVIIRFLLHKRWTKAHLFRIIAIGCTKPVGECMVFSGLSYARLGDSIVRLTGYSEQ